MWVGTEGEAGQAKSVGVASSLGLWCSPVEKALPSGKKETALMSDSWPAKVRTALPCALMSQTLAKASQAPDTKIDGVPGEAEIDMTSPLWSWKVQKLVPASTSHNMQVMSPEEVRIFSPSGPRKRQQER